MTEIELTRKQKAFAQREQDIIAAALSLFDGPNWQTVTVEKIAQQAEIGKGTVYKHFASKEEIYARIAINHFQQFSLLINHMDYQNGVVVCLQKLVEQCLRLSVDQPVAAKVTHYCKSSDFKERLTPELAVHFEVFDRDSDEMIFKMLEAGMAKGEIPKQSIEELVLAMHSCFHGVLAMIWDGVLQDYDSIKQDDFIRINTKFMIAGALGYQGD